MLALRAGAVALLAVIAPSGVSAGEARLAVAANFAAVADELGAAFRAETGHEVEISTGSTGGLYTQISQGAPFEVFFSADNVRPRQLVAAGFAVEGTVFTYAVGRLVLFSPMLDVGAGAEVLKTGDFAHLAIADPVTAPYGAAAMATLAKLGTAELLADKLVVGQNISQTLQFVDSGNAELGFVALSQLVGRADGFRWVVPAELHPPIIQDAVLLAAGAIDPAAKAFVDFVRSEEGRDIMAGHGYEAAD